MANPIRKRDSSILIRHKPDKVNTTVFVGKRGTMLRKKSIYKCEVCGNIIESLWNGKMTFLLRAADGGTVADTVDAAREKHVPVIEKNGNKVTVKVGSVPHPMLPEHYILFVELLVRTRCCGTTREGDIIAGGRFHGGRPERADDGQEYCNLHGLLGQLNKNTGRTSILLI